MLTLTRPCFLFASAAPTADELVVLVEIPEAQRPPADERGVREERPVFFLDDVVQLRRETGRRDRTGVPSRCCEIEIALAHSFVFRGKFASTLFGDTLAVGRHEPLAGLDELRQRRFGI